MSRTTIKITPEVKERLRQFKNTVSNAQEKDMTYSDAVNDLLDRAGTLSDYLRGR